RVLGTAGHPVSEEHEGSRPLRAHLHRQQRRRLYDHRLLRRLCLPPDRRRRLGLDRAPVLLATTLASFGWLVFTMWGGALSDRLGRVRTFQIGYVLLI